MNRDKELREIYRKGYITLRKPYCKPEKISLDDPRAIAFIETLTPSEKGRDE